MLSFRLLRAVCTDDSLPEVLKIAYFDAVAAFPLEDFVIKMLPEYAKRSLR